MQRGCNKEKDGERAFDDSIGQPTCLEEISSHLAQESSLPGQGRGHVTLGDAPGNPREQQVVLTIRFEHGGTLSLRTRPTKQVQNQRATSTHNLLLALRPCSGTDAPTVPLLTGDTKHPSLACMAAVSRDRHVVQDPAAAWWYPCKIPTRSFPSSLTRGGRYACCGAMRSHDYFLPG